MARTLSKMYDARLALLLTHTLRPPQYRSFPIISDGVLGMLQHAVAFSLDSHAPMSVNLDTCIALTLQPCSLIRPVVRGEI